MSGNLHAWLAIVGLALATVLTRSFFLLPHRALRLPGWLQRGLRHAPLAALMAVVVPEVLLTQGSLIADWRDARLFAVAASAGFFTLRRDITGTILAGTAVLLALRVTLGW